MAESTITLPPDASPAGKVLRTQELTVAGKVVEQEVVTLAGADGTLVALPGALDGDGGLKTHIQNLPATQPVSGTVGVNNFPATQPVSGSVAVSNLPATQPVSGAVAVSNLPASQAVTGPLTDTQLRATAVPVSGFPATQDVSDRAARLVGHVNVDNLPATQPISGTVTANLGTIDGAATETTLGSVAKDATLPKLVGTWDYRAGVSGTVVIPANGRVVGIAAHATTSGSFTINAGNSVPVPANVGIAVTPTAQLVAPTLVFTGTDSYFVEFVT